VGLSVCHSLQDAIHLQGLFPMLGKKIARAELQPEHGKLSSNENGGHITWWPYSTVQRHSLFKVVHEIA
jgi:hypothetical protein